MKHPDYTERAVTLVTAMLDVHLTHPDNDSAQAVLDEMLQDEQTEDGTVDPLVLKVVLNMFAAALRVLAKETDQNPETMWRNIALDYAQGEDNGRGLE